MGKFEKGFLWLVGLWMSLTPCCQQTQNLDANTILWFWDRATPATLKNTGKVHLFPKFPLLLVTLNRHEISSVNHCNKTLRDSALFEVEWVARSFTFPTPV